MNTNTERGKSDRLNINNNFRGVRAYCPWYYTINYSYNAVFVSEMYIFFANYSLGNAVSFQNDVRGIWQRSQRIMLLRVVFKWDSCFRAIPRQHRYDDVLHRFIKFKSICGLRECVKKNRVYSPINRVRVLVQLQLYIYFRWKTNRLW